MGFCSTGTVSGCRWWSTSAYIHSANEQCNLIFTFSIVFTRIPKYEQLTVTEKELYHEDKVAFNRTARAGIDSLYFAKAGKTGETWVPLVEKAFAKLHGDYASIMFGRTCDAVEDITGYGVIFSTWYTDLTRGIRGVSGLILTKVCAATLAQAPM